MGNKVSSKNRRSRSADNQARESSTQSETKPKTGN